MAVYVSNIIIEQGFNFDTTFELQDSRTNSFLDLTGCQVESKLRKTYSSSNYVSFEADIAKPKLGIIIIRLDSEKTLLLKPGRYVYDIKVISSLGGVYKAVEGSALVRAGVTK